MSRRAPSILLLACLTLTAGCTLLGPNPDSYTSTDEYTDRVQFAATGSQNGWITADGYTETGRGNYPSPEP